MKEAAIEKLKEDALLVSEAESTDDLVVSIAEALSIVTDEPVTELDPLSNYIDMDPVEQLMNCSHMTYMSFTYGDYSVGLMSDGSIIISEAEQ